MMKDDERSRTNGKKRDTIKSVETTFTIVESLKARNGARVTQIAADTGLSKGTVHKHLTTLMRLGFVAKEGDIYRVGFRFLDLGGFVRSQVPAYRIIKEKTRELAEETNEIAFFTTEENGRPVILFREVGQQGVPTRSRVGQRLYMHQIAAGKAILAEYPHERVREIIDQHGLPKATENTISDEERLFEELERIREQGFALSIEEATIGLQAAAVTVSDPKGDVLGACAVGGPVHRMDGEYFEIEIPGLLRSIANELELSIAYA
ncbi:IclR family transcriptional regulator [Halegenticoccus tardaugens]|uniref:IclR family transcriptional regulator n=1 Tax=Halegenticoccus tardaugens TaxID=2071624 RepID=UPI00100B10D7|nr:IclR family transcriptional regulator [Halegenticoccus tardaugens]